MYTALLLCLVAGASAAPFYPHGPPPYRPEFPSFHHSLMEEDMFDTRRFWAELENEMRQLDEILQEFYKQFPSITSQQGIVDNEYRVTIPLRGFDADDVIVKAREGVLMVQAVHKHPSGGQNSYLDIKTLPDFVDVNGTWTLEKDGLKIVFPLKAGTVTEASITEAPVTEGLTEEVQDSEHSREEMGSSSSDNSDADVGLRSGSREELMTNEIPRDRVEATTYAVDLKGEVDFVPVRY